ncbi:MAG TPA: hypothetical protein VJB59_13690 [Bdellovibrionota bacterium]|nr:hypothetical protein [Bdellovibrionota bacterium]
MQSAGKSPSFRGGVYLKFAILGLIVAFGVADPRPAKAATTSVSVYSGTFDGEHPAPTLVGKVQRGQEFLIEVNRLTALVNYPGRDNPVISERVLTSETGATVTCPWYTRIDQKPNVRVDQPYSTKVTHKATCQDGCTNGFGQPIPASDLLFGKFNLPKCTAGDGKDYGFYDEMWGETPPPSCPGKVCGPKIDIVPICCQEFTVERQFSELHYFDELLILDSYREEEFLDLDVDFRKIYLTFENERLDRATCVLTDLAVYGDVIRVADLKDCVLPPGNQFTLYAQSRFFLKDTRPCGKFVAKGIKQADGSYAADWFLGWYECDGKADRTPIEKQYSYATRLELKFTDSIIGG